MSKVKKLARLVQDATKMPYQTCHALITGQVVFVPQARDCIVSAALNDCGAKPPTSPYTPMRECECPRCDP